MRWSKAHPAENIVPKWEQVSRWQVIEPVACCCLTTFILGSYLWSGNIRELWNVIGQMAADAGE
jgi:transcriptional regulator with PAS, ATPase and Fis domain